MSLKKNDNSRGTKMTPERLIRIYKTMKAEPNKVWVKSELGLGYNKEKHYINTLVSLGLIEEVNCYGDYSHYINPRGSEKKILIAYRKKLHGWKVIKNIHIDIPTMETQIIPEGEELKQQEIK